MFMSLLLRFFYSTPLSENDDDDDDKSFVPCEKCSFHLIDEMKDIFLFDLIDGALTMKIYLFFSISNLFCVLQFPHFHKSLMEHDGQ